MTEKQLIVVVEGTLVLKPYWRSIVSGYLRKIIRSFSAYDIAGQIVAPSIEMSFVVFNLPGSCDCLVQRSSWTKDVNVFLKWLGSIAFTGDGFGEASIGEGFSEALMMFSLDPNGNQKIKHCILVAASDPYPLATPVYRPWVLNVDQDYQADAMSLASTFAECSISLSIISPNQLPKLRAIYNVGKTNSGAADPPVRILENPQFLVLLSPKFEEACSVLCPASSAAAETTELATTSAVAATVAMSTGVVPVGNIPLEQQLERNLQQLQDVCREWSLLQQQQQQQQLQQFLQYPVGNIPLEQQVEQILQQFQNMCRQWYQQQQPVGNIPLEQQLEQNHEFC